MNLTQESLGGDLTRIVLDGRLDLDGTQRISDQFSYRTTTLWAWPVPDPLLCSVLDFCSFTATTRGWAESDRTA